MTLYIELHADSYPRYEWHRMNHNGKSTCGPNGAKQTMEKRNSKIM